MSVSASLKDTIAKLLDSTNGKIVAGALLVVLLPVLAGYSLAIRILLFTIFALGYNLLLGYGGEMSFGHSAFFGIGAYGTILTLQRVPSVPVGIAGGLLAASLAGLVFGLISLRRRGIYFSMITLALAQMVYIFFLQATDLTGGFNGISIPLEVTSVLPIGSADPLFYLGTVLLLLVVWVIVWRVLNSQFGQVLVAIRENEERARALGYNTSIYLTIAFVASALVSGLAGSFLALLSAYISPDVLFWTTSGEVVLITIIGGAGTLGGPLVGAAVFMFVSGTLNEFVGAWEFYFGLLITLVVLFAPEGIYGYLKER